MAFHNDPDFEVAEAANGVRQGSEILTPWKAYGTLPSSPQVLGQINGDPMKERASGYGFYAIDEIVYDFKPDVYIGIEDIWAFHGYDGKPWWDKINKVIWNLRFKFKRSYFRAKEHDGILFNIENEIKRVI